MAKKNQVMIDIIIDDKGTTKRVAMDADKLGIQLDKAGKAAGRGAKNTEKLSKSQKDLDRNMRGTAKMSGNTTKEFSKMQQGMGGLVGAYATLAAQIFAVSAAFQFMSDASDFRNLIKGQEALGAITGTAYKTMTNSIIAATDAQIKYGDAAKAAAIGTAAGLTAGQLTALGAAAKNVSFALGRDLTDSFNRLVRGVTKAEPELLDELGIILRLEPATQAYADSIGKSRDALTAFERTQAVTNEVLTQAEKKFGAIQDLMDPNAAALSKFTKSFDDLVNVFKIGLIETLIPAFLFLSQNTAALTATFTLFALPIIKSIIPSLSSWSNATKKNAEEQSAYSEKYRREVKEDAAVTKRAFQDRQGAMDKANKKATKNLSGTSTKSAGLNFMRGEVDTKSGQRAAQKIIKNALDQTKNNAAATTGYLQGQNRQQILDHQKSLDARILALQKHGAKTRQIFRGITSAGKVMAGSIQAAWAGAMGMMSSLASKAARLMNGAFKLIAFVGIASMIIDGVKAIYRYFVPITDEMERQANVIEGLTGKYKTLAEEMRNAAIARNKFMAGSEITSSMGRSVQSADVAGIITNLQQLDGMDETSKEYQDLAKDINKVIAELISINPEFIGLQSLMDGTATFADGVAEKMRALGVSIAQAGNDVDTLPDSLKSAKAALNDFLKSEITTTPLSAFVQEQRMLLKQLNSIVDSTTARQLEFLNTKFPNVVKEMIDARTHMDNLASGAVRPEVSLKDRIIQAIGSSSPGPAGFMGAGPLAEEMQTEQRKVEALAKQETVIAEILEKHELIVQKTTETNDALKKEKELRDKHLDLFTKSEKLNNSMVTQNRKLQTDAKNALKRQTLGLTIQGKIENLEIKRVSNAAKLAKADQAHELAILAAEAAAEKDTVRAQEQLELSREKKLLAVEEFKRAEEKLDNMKEELYLQKQMNILQLQRMQREAAASVTKRALKRESDQGGGTRSSRANIGRMTGQNLIQAIADEKANGETLAFKRQESFEKKMKELQGIETTEMGLNSSYVRRGTSTLVAEATGEMAGQDKEILGSAEKVKDLNLQKETRDATEQTFMRTLTAEKEELAIQRELTGVFNSNLTLKRLEAALAKDLQVDRLSGAQMEVLRAEAREIDKQNFLLESQIQIADGLRNGFIGAFASLIDGTKSAKQAFADMARNMLSMLAQIMAKMLVMKLLEGTSFGSFLGFEKGGITPGYAKGGYSLNKNNYSRGGTARGPQSGYAATLHGNEAVVPLPDNRSIPVTLNGAGGQNNNVVVNVSMDGQGGGQQSSQSNSEMGKNIGAMVASAVQEELQSQKRSGGILNPYGVS